MKTPTAGVYALTHLTTGKIYIGSSMNVKQRWAKWRQRMNVEHHNLPPAIGALTTSRHDWKFSVVWDGTGATAKRLEQYEVWIVAALRRRAPDRILNEMPVQRPDNAGLTVGERTMTVRAWSRETGINRNTIAHRLKYNWTPEQAVGLAPALVRDYRSDARQFGLIMAGTTILDDDGEPMLIGEAAAAIGCAYDTLANRLARRRKDHGETEVTLAELKTISEKYRKTP